MANLPYNVAVPVLLHLLEEVPTLRRVLVMVQAEVADRLVAGPGSRPTASRRSRRAGTATAQGRVGRPLGVLAGPNVDSGLVALTRREPPATTAGRAEVFAVVDAAFAQRRKTLRAALAGVGRLAPPPPRRCCGAAGVDPSARGEQLDVADFARIASATR